MEKKCCVCKATIPFNRIGNTICKQEPDYVLCDECYAYLDWMREAKSEVDLNAAFAFFQPIFDNPHIPNRIKDELIAIRFKDAKQKEEEYYSQENKKAMASLLLTTSSSFEGYRVTKYIDVLCEEVIFKNSFINQLSAGLEDFGNALKFRSTEMSGSTELIANARAYGMEKFKTQAIALGANAILGMDFESSIGGDIVRVAIFGTAVCIEKI